MSKTIWAAVDNAILQVKRWNPSWSDRMAADVVGRVMVRLVDKRRYVPSEMSAYDVLEALEHNGLAQRNVRQEFMPTGRLAQIVSRMDRAVVDRYREESRSAGLTRGVTRRVKGRRR